VVLLPPSVKDGIAAGKFGEKLWFFANHAIVFRDLVSENSPLLLEETLIKACFEGDGLSGHPLSTGKIMRL
jgi:hypothetical protein